MRKESLDHILLSGPPSRQTTLAHILAKADGRQRHRQPGGPVIEKAGDLAGLLTKLRSR